MVERSTADRMVIGSIPIGSLFLLLVIYIMAKFSSLDDLAALYGEKITTETRRWSGGNRAGGGGNRAGGGGRSGAPVPVNIDNSIRGNIELTTYPTQEQIQERKQERNFKQMEQTIFNCNETKMGD